MKLKNWIIRRANLSDLSALEHALKQFRSPNDQITVDFQKEITESPVWIAEYNNQLIGSIILHLEKDAVHIVFIMTSPEFNDQGLGRSLVEFAEKEAQKRKCTHITLSTNKTQLPLLSLHEHLGWIMNGEIGTNLFMKKTVAINTSIEA